MSSAPRHAHGAPSKRFRLSLDRSAVHSFAFLGARNPRSARHSHESAVLASRQRRSPMRAVFVMFLAVSVLAATAILPKGMGAYSLWGDTTAAAVSGNISTGQVEILSTGSPVYLLDQSAFDPNHDVLRPGETFTVSFDTRVKVTGSNMEPKLELSGWTLPESVRDSLDVSVSTSELVVSPDEQTVTITLSLTSTSEAMFNGELINLSAAQLVLSTGTVWQDTLYPLDVPLQDIHLGIPQMVLNYDTSLPGATNNVLVPLGGLSLGAVTIDWGDGSPVQTVVSANPTHVYAVAGPYTVTITGGFTRFGLDNEPDTSRAGLVSVSRWDANGVTNAAWAFSAAYNLASVARPPASITNMQYMFVEAYGFNGDVSDWNVTNVTDMQGMFAYATAFNQPIGGWNVANVADMSSMFTAASGFNQDISAWNVANVTNMSFMFSNTVLFNQDIGAWNVANVTNMNYMFFAATGFAQDLSLWDVAANLPTMPLSWNQGAPGLALAFSYRWPLPWQPMPQMVLNYNTSLPGATNNVAVPVGGLTLGTVTIDWGDGSPVQTVVSANPTHNYAVAGPYTVTIKGKFTRFGNPAYDGSHAGLVSVSRWDANGVTDATAAFHSAYNLQFVATPPATITRMMSMFEGATIFNGDLSAWNVANVTSMDAMFFDASAFNQDIGGWDVSNVTSMNGMFQSASAFNQDISGWDVANVAFMNMMFVSASAFAQDLSGWDVGALLPTMPFYWNFNAPGLSSTFNYRWPLPWQPLPQMVLNYDTSLPGATNNVLVPVGGLSLGTVTIDWGDGSPVQTVVSANPTHNYAVAGTYTVKIRGEFTSYGNTVANTSNAGLISVSQWDANGVTDATSAFDSASNLQSVAAPPATITNMKFMFSYAAAFNQDISSWDVSNVTDMSGMFNYAAAFNQPIGAWNVGNVTHMDQMFERASTFNQSLGNWNVANVSTMSGMFRSSQAFNNDGSDSIKNWVTTSLVNTASMFEAAYLFDQPIGSWNMSGVTTTSKMFYAAYQFNQSLDSWNMTNVTDISYMFRGASAFDQPLNNWNVSSVANMNFTFGQGVFNQDLYNWDVSNVTNMDFMFSGNSVFDRDLSAWNVAKISTIPVTWNFNTPGLAPEFKYRWPLAWQ
ncbi:BspA family leucine-rich repeat surface protein [Leucobacter sp. UT-8R-CII-1-4]|uniref:BspA family leucine-rich repeat surface protein n=1 Tax=Leucobacter sp. UT-8R-CII-1-4 TaxID=3040075 RepID=UPI0024A888C2|nr:BspA family leucine-rich repeat surface protein [Leucobacter sp. UT-8R-CII-1-4]MDI6022815.1 BspA family leucine-rich repeat surface protein [Leucobacter sp. UT-8R-CII-1-4]